eukprot:1264342-Prymnesium_polylepis.2
MQQTAAMSQPSMMRQPSSSSITVLNHARHSLPRRSTGAVDQSNKLMGHAPEARPTRSRPGVGSHACSTMWRTEFAHGSGSGPGSGARVGSQGQGQGQGKSQRQGQGRGQGERARLQHGVQHKDE